MNMREIKTRIDDVFEFIQERGKTTAKEVSKEVGVDNKELETFVHVLKKNGLIRVRYALVNTYLYSQHYTGEETTSFYDI